MSQNNEVTATEMNETETNNAETVATVETPKVETKKRVKRPLSEMIAEIGQFRIDRIVRETVPSDKLIGEIETAEKELKITIDLVSNLPESHKVLGETAIKNAQFKVNALREKMANPSNISLTDREVLRRAAVYILKHGSVNVVALAQFVGEGKEIFPLKGTKY
jgi:hypothetical protein